MTTKKIFFISFTSLIIAAAYFLINPYQTSSYNYDLKLGEIADSDVNAPFDFYVYKTPETLSAEKEAAAQKIQPVYKVSDNLKFNVQKNLDFIFQHFLIQNNKTAETIQKKLEQNGYEISLESIRYLQNDANRMKIYNQLAEDLNRILDIGIYPEDYNFPEIKIAKFNRIRSYELSRLYSLEEAKAKLQTKFEQPIEKQIVQEIAELILIENIVIDEEQTNNERERAKDKVLPTLGKVQKNEQIISKNHKVTTLELLKLRSLLKASQEYQSADIGNHNLMTAFGVFIFSFFQIILLFYIILLFFDKEFSSQPRLIILLASFLLTIFFTILMNDILKFHSLLIPFSLASLLIAIIFNPNIGLIFNIFNFSFFLLFLNWSLQNPIILFVGTIGGLIALKKIKNNHEIYPPAFYLGTSLIIMITAMTLIRSKEISIFIQHLIWGLGSGFLSIIGLAFLAPVVERKLNLATKQRLLELLDFDNPLMQKLSKFAPGTYHHSIIVGNLAESAAEAIGANHLLARVGSYYHDIGKLENPQFFIENDENSSKLHDDLLANESSRLIRDHIQDGLVLAKKYKLPKPVIDIINQHHGTAKIKYFYQKALETKLQCDEKDFHYTGPKPRSKESAIVMIADIVESTTKSLDSFSEERIKQVLDRTVNNLINEGQLDEAPLTLKELETIKSYMLPILLGVYRKRLEYPE